jgi:phage-related protein
MMMTALSLAVSATSGISTAITAANNATNSMIDELKSSQNITINRVGRVLEGAKAGFLLGYVTPSILTAVGVALTTGDLLIAVGGGIGVLSNPVAGVCAAVGAVYFGWKALSEKERDSILSQVGEFLNVGYELIKSVINLALKLMKNLLTTDNLNELRESVSDAAESVGRHLSDITHSARDKFSEAAESIQNTAKNAAKGVSSLTNKFSRSKGKGLDNDK